MRGVSINTILASLLNPPNGGLKPVGHMPPPRGEDPVFSFLSDGVTTEESVSRGHFNKKVESRDKRRSTSRMASASSEVTRFDRSLCDVVNTNTKFVHDRTAFPNVASAESCVTKCTYVTSRSTRMRCKAPDQQKRSS